MLRGLWCLGMWISSCFLLFTISYYLSNEFCCIFDVNEMFEEWIDDEIDITDGSIDYVNKLISVSLDD